MPRILQIHLEIWNLLHVKMNEVIIIDKFPNVTSLKLNINKSEFILLGPLKEFV